MRRLSHEEQIAAIASVNPDVEVLGEITGADTKVSCRCKVCDHEWSTRPADLKRGCGCPKCGRLIAAQSTRLTHAEHLSAIVKVNPDIEVLGEIKGNKYKVPCRCKICGHEWFTTPDVLKRGNGCPKCGYLKAAKKNTLSHEEQIAAIAKANPNVEVLGRIVNNTTKVLCRCKVCDHEWMVTPDSLKSGHGCRKCARNAKLTYEEQIAAIARVNPNIEVLGEITGNNKKVLCRCKICSHEWFPTPNSLKNGYGCPKCGRLRSAQSHALSHEEHLRDIYKVNPNIEVLGEITGADTKVLCRCKVCGHEWSGRPASLKKGTGCPKCSGKMKLTHDEQVAAIAKVNPNIEVLGKITNGKTKVLCRCKICDHEWLVTPGDLKGGKGCPECARLRVAQSRRLSHEEHIADIAMVNPDVEVLEEIKNADTKVLCRCKVCDHKWMIAPITLKSGHGCRKCAMLRVAQRLILSHEEQIAAIAKANPNVEVLGRIVNNTTKVLCRCKVCDHEWMTRPASLKSRQGCPKCAKYGFLSHDHGKLYIMVDDLEVPTVMKIGVSVQEDKRRNEILKSAHKAGVIIPDLHIVKTWEGATEKMYELESAMHKAFSNYKINFPAKFSGSEEFFYYRPEVFGMVEEEYKEIVCCQ